MVTVRMTMGSALIAAAISASGCTGGVSLPAGFDSVDQVAGPSASGHGGSNAGGGSGGSAGVGDDPGGPATLDPERVTLRRLNRAEYNNTVRDLLGTMTAPADQFPGDTVTDGFDTVGTALSFSQLLAEQAESAADKLVTELLGRPKGDAVRARVMVCEPTVANASTCDAQILKAFLPSAYRRPVDASEVQSLVDLAASIQQSSGDPLRGLQGALKAALLSPHFLFHVELGDPASPKATPLNDYELASRLSYFLWSSMPDPELLSAAAGSALTTDASALGKQLERMIDDPKAMALVDNFGGQWLSIREVGGFSPDPTLFPKFDESLRSSIAGETQAFLHALIADNLPLTSLLLADFSYVNDRLAKHYGLAGGQTGYVRTSLQGTPRLGLLTQETFLTVNSQPDRTSPVKRGNWVLERILCDPPPSPPPGIPPLDTPASGTKLTVRAALEQHRSRPPCAGCHSAFDPVGLGFENFDAIGSYRTTDNGVTIDASGTMLDGRAFQDNNELIHILASDPRFTRCTVKQALTYAVGRSFESDEANNYVTALATPLAGKATFRDLLHTVVDSEAFRTRRGEAL